MPIPTDVVTAKEFAATAKAEIEGRSTEVQDDDLILDIGPDTAKALAAQLEKAGTIVWNGPVGVFEFDQFGNGTKTLADAIANSPAFSIAGGGDTLAAIAEVRHPRQGQLYLDRRRRVPRIPRRQEAAGGRSPGIAGLS